MMYENFLRNVITVGFILNFLLNFWCVCVLKFWNSMMGEKKNLFTLSKLCWCHLVTLNFECNFQKFCVVWLSYRYVECNMLGCGFLHWNGHYSKYIRAIDTTLEMKKYSCLFQLFDNSICDNSILQSLLWVIL